MYSHLRKFLSNAWPLAGVMLVLFVYAQTSYAQARPEPNKPPAALIKNIVVGTLERTTVDPRQAVVRRETGEPVVVSTGLILYRGDVIETFAATRVTILFLDAPVLERANEVIIDANSQVGISSTDSWWGRIQAKVKGAFRSRSKYVQLSPRGTEYDFKVFRNETRSVLIMLENDVKATKGNYKLVGRNQTSGLVPEIEAFKATAATRFFESFAHGVGAQEQYGRTLDIPRGSTEVFTFNFTISNNCGQSHKFEFRTSSGTPWLSLDITRTVSIAARSEQRIEGVVKADATHLAPASYRGKIYASCVDCEREQRCNRINLEWPISLRVTDGPTVSPSPSPDQSQDLLVRDLEEVTFTTGVDQPRKAPDSDVIEALDWTNEVILPTQPTYVAPNLLPHFGSNLQRSGNFRSARQDSILLKGKAGSNKILGNIYSDWGEGTRAFTAYEKELTNDSSQRASTSFLADLSEAYRVTGKFDDARKTLTSVPARDQQSAPIRNAYGNLNLMEAEVARDQGKPDVAQSLLGRAQEDYRDALSGRPRSGSVNRDATTTLQSNLGEAYSASGNVALQQGQAAEARKQFEIAERGLANIQQANPEFPHPVTELGRVYQGLGRVAVLEGNRADAVTAFSKAIRQHNLAIKEHADFAAAYSNLGDVYVDVGDTKAAKENYRLAIRARPEQPAPYYPLALLVQDEDRQLAKSLAGIYLQLLPEPFKQGERARNAERVTRGDFVPPPKPVLAPGEFGDGGVDGGGRRGNETDTQAVVPSVVGMSSVTATALIEARGLRTDRVESRADRQLAGTVLEQTPAAEKRVSLNSTVDLIVSAGPGPVGNIRVPEIVDDKLETSRRKLEQRGLRVGQVTERPSCDKVGKVLEQNPRKDTRVGEGTAVDLVIGGIGSDGVEMPALVGRKREDAEQMIVNNGLRLTRVRTEESDLSEGSVISQKPKERTPLARDCPVEITVAIPIPYVTVDNYVGATESDARQRLSNIGLSASVMRQKSGGNPGIVLQQSPAKGGRVRRGGGVTLVVSEPLPIEFTTVPDLSKLNKKDAEAAITAARLKVGKVTGPKDQFGNLVEGTVVFEQNPAKGSQVPVGTPVDFMLAQIFQ